MENKTAIVVNDLCFSYGSHDVLKGINACIEEGKVTTIMGANGCGKSTLFSLMTKSLTPKSGNVTLYEKDIKDLSVKSFAKKVAIVQQYNSVMNDVTVEKLVSFGRTPYRKKFGSLTKKDRIAIEQAMEDTNISHLRNREVSRLSGGQKQRVWIAMALAQGTKTLFLDEPTTYLDIRYQIEILELVKHLNQTKGLTIVMILHDINQAIHYSDQIIGLKDGVVLASGDPMDVINEETIKEIYGIDLEVKDVDGKIVVMTDSKKEI